MTEENNVIQNQNTHGTQSSFKPEEPQQDIFDPADIEKNKNMAGLAYLLFFIPLLACPDSAFGKFHANQGLLLLIVAIGGNIVLGMIPLIGWVLMPFYGIGILVLAVMGLINGFGGKAKRLPLFGKYTILK